MLRTHSVRALLVLAFGSLCIADAAEIALEVRRELDSRGAIYVLAGLSPGVATPRASRIRQATDSGTAQDRVIARLPAGCKVRHRYRYTPALALEITSEDALEALAELPEVARIALDVEGRGALLESRALVRANEVFDLGVTGKGRVVAILDTGVDAAAASRLRPRSRR